jgi:hypothetical protein
VPLDVALARETALVRGETGLRTPDAVQVAALCVTNDRRWVGRLVAPAVVVLEEYAG